MVENSCRFHARRNLSGRPLRAAVVGLTAILGLAAADRASAQMTKEMLIGDAVSEVGTRYADVDEAIKRFANRDFLGARTFLEAANRKDASLPPPDLILAKMHFLAGNAAAGRASLEETAMQSPEDPEAYLILADQAIQQRRLIEAESLYEKARTLTDKFSGNAKRKRNFEIRARTGSALVAEHRRNWPAAQADLQALLKLDPDNATGRYRLGQALFMQKQFKEGYNEFVAARKLNKNIPDAYVAAALMYDQLEQPNEAQQAFDRALKTSGSDANTLTAYSQWLIKRGSVEKAESILAEARKTNPESLNLWILSGVAARMNKKMKPAEDHFMEALRISPANVDTINQLALLLIEQGDQSKRQRALEFAGISSRLNNESADAQITLAWVLYQLGRTAEAEQAFRNGLQLGTNRLSPDSSFLVAKLLVDQKREEAAIQVLKGALEMETPGIFVNRQEAQVLLDTLEKG
jgi:tetratricopeptide (TPR) repeat protein